MFTSLKIQPSVIFLYLKIIHLREALDIAIELPNRLRMYCIYMGMLDHWAGSGQCQKFF